MDITEFDVDSGTVKLQEQNVIMKSHWTTVRCKYCQSNDTVVKFGSTSKGNQRYYCVKCEKTFQGNKAPDRMHYPVDAIASAVSQFYEAASLHKIERQIRMDYGITPSFMTIYLWVVKYSQKAAKALAYVPIGTTDMWVADETVIKLKFNTPQNMWFWDVIDDGTKFLLASYISETRTTKDAKVLMEKAERRANAIPSFVITDKLKSYLDAIEMTWGADTKHVQSGPFVKGKTEDSTRAIERFHGTLKDRTKIMRGLGSKESAKIITDGWLVHYNFFRPHSGLKGKTPAEAAGAKSPYRNWKEVVGS